jgi:hypothetical protein
MVFQKQGKSYGNPLKLKGTWAVPNLSDKVTILDF